MTRIIIEDLELKSSKPIKEVYETIKNRAEVVKSINDSIIKSQSNERYKLSLVDRIQLGNAIIAYKREMRLKNKDFKSKKVKYQFNQNCLELMLKLN